MSNPQILRFFIVFAVVLVNPAFSLDNGLALTPPMGWLTWQRFRCETDCANHPNECINESLIKSMADQMASKGYLEAGYEYIIVDDCWASKERDMHGRLQGDLERFPSGMKALADYVHEKGLKFGIYGDYGNFTCGGYPGSLQYLETDAMTWADWGVDYLKLDGCYVELEGIDQGYGMMTKFLNQTGRPIVFSCSFPAYVGIKANLSAAVEYCNLWRNYGDISDTFEDVKDIADWFGDNQKQLMPFAGPGHWNDPDMLLIGNFGLSLEQSKHQMTIWAILAAPLIMSVDLRAISDESADILQHPKLIRINQDPLGIQGELVKIVSLIKGNSTPVFFSTLLKKLLTIFFTQPKKNYKFIKMAFC
ncbi:unnamed protein product [Brassicogethes aeneus]|uniref:Alpha-galactosidase n=1 Tax=Brassicogethes aeneus TaxID=1431903 RepID=A0A9P0AZH4_BRAAE|nr:unnamed protein product [Brassicogethes aeneus]